jgi:hypothetical protein
MNTNEIIKSGVVGGVVTVVIELLAGVAVPSMTYVFGIIALLIGGFIAGWMIDGKNEDAVVAGGVAGIVYGILGMLILYPLLSSHFRHSPSGYFILIVGSIIVAAIGGFAGNYFVARQAKAKPSKGKK